MSSEPTELIPIPYRRARSTRYSYRLHDFSVTVPRWYNDVYLNSSLPRTCKLWNSLVAECFPLTYDLISFKSRVNRQFILMFFLNNFPFSPCIFLFRLTPCLGYSALHGVILS